MQNLNFDTSQWVTVKGGMSRIAERAAAILGSENIHLNSRVDRIAYTEDGAPPAALHSIVDRPTWASLSARERIRICLHDLSKFYADEADIDVYDQYIEAFDVLWMNEFCGG
ncbi:hypothetical protein MY11210_001562 [Beauveria gryllotalpidicola]